MRIYRFRSFGPDRKVIAVQRFFAPTDHEAISLAHAMVDDDPVVASFDIWADERPIHGAAPIRKYKGPRSAREKEKAPSG